MAVAVCPKAELVVVVAVGVGVAVGVWPKLL